MTIQMSFSQIQAIVCQMQDMCHKLQNTRLRCSRSERLDCPKLAAHLLDTANALSRNILDHSVIKAPDKAAEELAERLRSSCRTLTSSNKTILRRNMNLIFLGPQVSELDSIQVKMRKKATQGRCNTVGSLTAGRIVQWSISLPPSKWGAGDMGVETFDYLLQELEKLIIPEWPKDVIDCLRALSSESPLDKCEKFCSFVEGTYSRDPKGKYATNTRSYYLCSTFVHC